MPAAISQRWIRPAALLCAIAAQIFALRLDWTFDSQTRPDLQRMIVGSRYALLFEDPGDPGNNTLLHYQASAIHNHFVTLEMASARLSDQSQSYLAGLLPPSDASQVAYAPERPSKPLSGTPCRAAFQVDFAPQKTSQPRSVRLYPPLTANTQIDNVRSVSLESSSELAIRVSTNSDNDRTGPGCHERLTMGKWEQSVGADIELAFIAVPNSRVTLSLSPGGKGSLHSGKEELDSLMIEPLNPRRLSIGPYGLAKPDQIRDRVGPPFLAVKDLGLGADFLSIEVSGLVGVPISEVLGAWKWLLLAGVNAPLVLWLSKAFLWRTRGLIDDGITTPEKPSGKMRDLRPELPPAAQRAIEAGGQTALEMASVVFTDIVSYSLQPMEQQISVLRSLQEIVRGTNEYARAEARREMIGLPTGDGMALVFFGDPTVAAQCAVEIGRALRNHAEIKLRIGVHNGPVYRIADINANQNVSGGGINMAQRVMDCGDAGHILLSASVADVLGQLQDWPEHIKYLGEQEVKHGVKVRLYNLIGADFGNPELPSKIRAKARAGGES